MASNQNKLGRHLRQLEGCVFGLEPWKSTTKPPNQSRQNWTDWNCWKVFCKLILPILNPFNKAISTTNQQTRDKEAQAFHCLRIAVNKVNILKFIKKFKQFKTTKAIKVTWRRENSYTKKKNNRKRTTASDLKSTNTAANWQRNGLEW